MDFKDKNKKAFTLIELLVVIAIIGLLSTIAVASLSSSREKARIAKAQQFSGSIRTGLGFDLVGEWNFNDFGDMGKDTSGYGNDGTIHGATPVANCISGNCLSFDGGNDYVSVPTDDILNPDSSSFTVSAWFNWGGKTGENIIYNKENLYEARVSNGYFHYAWQPHWSWDGGNSFQIVSGKWHHVVVVYDKSKQYIYGDGELVYLRNQTGNMGTNNNRLGIGTRGTGGPSNVFHGLIDDVRVYNSALTLSQVRKIYTEGLERYKDLAKAE